MTFGEKIRILRNKANWTQPELAKKLDIEQSYVSKLENDIHTPSEDVLHRLALVFEQTQEELLHGVDQQIIRKAFKHMPHLLDKIITYESHLSKYFRQWLILNIGFIILGVFIFLLGQYHLILSEDVYNYRRDVEYYSQNKECLIIHNTTEILQQGKPCGSLIQPDTFFTFQHVGEVVERIVDGERKIYTLYNVDQLAQWGNQLMKTFGLLLISLGGIGLLLEKRLHGAG